MFSLRRRYIHLCIIIFLCFFIYFCALELANRNEREFFYENYVLRGGVNSNQNYECHLPIDVNPFDDSIKHLIKSLPNKVICKYNRETKELTYINENGFVKIRDDSLSHNNNNNNNDVNFLCYYQMFEKSNTDDNDIVYHKKQILDFNDGIQMLNNNFVSVECRDRYTNRVFYENTHFWFPLNNHNHNSHKFIKYSKKEFRKNVNFHSERPSVLILVIESLSRLNFLRSMPKTKESLDKIGNFIYLNGLTKLADNSFPNMVPLLTGKRVWANELLNENHGPYDDWPFVWKDFSRNGYKTALIEDFPTFTLFNYEAKGFINSPTDWYPHPFWIHLYHSIPSLLIDLIPFQLSNCYNDRVPKIDIFLDQLRHFIRQCNSHSQPYFAFSFYIEVTHNDFNKAQIIDSHISAFMEDIKEQLNDTVIILMGDHGNRFGSILQTVIGRIEERMPLFTIRIPDSLKHHHPHLKAYLDANSNKLMTWLDIHQLLKDITNGNYSSMGVPHATRSHYSPWREYVPASRLCSESYIPDIYCVCDDRRNLNVTDRLTFDASQTIVNYINNLVPLSLCHNLTLKAPINAELILPNGAIAKPKGFEQRIELTILVMPSEAIFRAQLSRSANSPEWIIKGEINRINEYGNQSHCVHERSLKPFCYCL